MEYRTVQGDTWDRISNIFYNTEYFVHTLLQANPELVDIVIFSSNTSVQIPSIEISSYADNSRLPPWKKDVDYGAY